MYQVRTCVDDVQFWLELRGETNRGLDGAPGILGAVSNDQCCNKRPVGVLSREGEAPVTEAEGVLLLVIDYREIALPSGIRSLLGASLCPGCPLVVHPRIILRAGRRTTPLWSKGPAGTEGETPAGLWTTEFNILAMERC
jgi:hypothetical protein